jgi:hypothetical protein
MLERGNTDCEIETLDFAFSSDRRLYRCSGRIIIEPGSGLKYLIRTKQEADTKDRLIIDGDKVKGVLTSDGEPVFYSPVQSLVNDGGFRREPMPKEVFWRFKGENQWRPDTSIAGPGPCEFAWLDRSTGHVRGKQTATLLPPTFRLTQQRTGAFSSIQLSGWDGSATLEHANRSAHNSWSVHVDPPSRAHLTLCLRTQSGATLTLKVPLATREWLANWNGEVVQRDTLLSLSDLSEIVARAASPVTLIGEIRSHLGLEAKGKWIIAGEVGLSGLRNDFAALIRPLGIDAKLELDFHNGFNEYWYVAEFGNSLEWEPGERLRPREAIVGDQVRLCGRCLGAPEFEKDLGPYIGSRSGLGGRPIELPKLYGPWLIYLREGSRVLTRPKLIEGLPLEAQPQHKLGRAMVLPLEDARSELGRLAKAAPDDPAALEQGELVQPVIDLILSLNGLPAQTFEVFKIVEVISNLAPRLLYRCRDDSISQIVDLFDSLLASWSLLPVTYWQRALEAEGRLFIEFFDDARWALDRMNERKDQLVLRVPYLAGVLKQQQAATWAEINARFATHTSEAVDKEAHVRNPFRPDFDQLLPNSPGNHPASMRVFDAPFAAALTALGKIKPNKSQIMAIKDVERRHPNFFTMAYCYFLKEARDA